MLQYFSFRVALDVCSNITDFFSLLKQKAPNFSSTKYTFSKKDGYLIGIFECPTNCLFLNFHNSYEGVKLIKFYINFLFFLPLYVEQSRSGTDFFITSDFLGKTKPIIPTRTVLATDVVFLYGTINEGGESGFIDFVNKLKDNSYLQSYFFTTSTMNGIFSYYLVVELKQQFLEHNFDFPFLAERKLFVCLKQVMGSFVARTITENKPSIITCNLESKSMLNKLYSTEFTKRVDYLTK